MKPSRSVMLAGMVAATVLICVSCASDIGSMRGLSPVDPDFVPGQLHEPDPLTRSRAEVGDVMLEAGEFDYRPPSNKYPAITIDPQPELEVEHKRHVFRFPLKAGPYKLVAESSQGKYYRYLTPFGSRKAYGGLFVPTGQDVATDFFWWWYARDRDEDLVPANVYSVPLPNPVEVTHTEHLEPRDGSRGRSSGPTATLTYAGVAAGEIRFVYKEFTERGMARPAFTQEVILDYNPGETYAYKSARFVVHEAGTTHILYTLLEGL
ncbi:hypothetical protein G4Y73_02205 [Wenzhouxiangella sp. XN201]|uniref:hypothetical protein n=1 Tax=Wenzhouxiangella sp. XN201 TaxID=2710755 RepID=UPI0013CAFB38|nr:hypothetical protein [Wenzhouxiangella sp. XN201]NEZ02958.1 hypothetical protein [Wenzhouxiangella sp. XN201]